ncbi:MAG: hypothetical protein WEG56_09765 [Chloroflexota bacterium]
MTGRQPAALSKARYGARLQAAFLRLYDQDAEVTQAMLSLLPTAEAADIVHGSAHWRTPAGLWILAAQPWDRQPPERRPPRIAAVMAFTHAADELAVEFGLNRLGNAGRAHIFGWCERYLRVRAAGGVRAGTHDPMRLSVSPVWAGTEPEIVGQIDSPWESESWDPTREPRRDARVRLERLDRNHIRTNLDRIAAEAKAAGLTFPDTAPNLRRDLGWLFHRVRFMETFQDIFDSLDSPPDGGVDTVRKAVLRMAARVGVDASGWETGWR